MLAKEVVEYARAFLEEGHYVMIVTNGTISKRFDDIASFPAHLNKHLFFKFSYHYLELKQRGLLDVFFNNIRKVRDAGCSFTLELTPSDDAIPYIDEIKQRAIAELGAPNHVTIARDERTKNRLPMLTQLSRQDYIDTWSTFNSALFDYKLTIFGHKRREFCYAGDWSFCVNLATGKMKQCYRTYYRADIFKDISRPIPFRAIGNCCKEHHCYNGHSLIVLGDIPSQSTPTYAQLRNRQSLDGSEWLRPEMKSFMSTRLKESNTEYTLWKKIKANLRNLTYHII